MPDTVTKISDAINALPDEKTITINVKAEGNLSSLLDKSETSVGNAFADGTQSKGLAHDEKNAFFGLSNKALQRANITR